MFQAICTNLCCKNYQSMPNSEDCSAKKLSTSGVHLDDSILDKRKKTISIIAPTCAVKYLDHSIVEQKEKYVSGNLHQPVL